MRKFDEPMIIKTEELIPEKEAAPILEFVRWCIRSNMLIRSRNITQGSGRTTILKSLFQTTFNRYMDAEEIEFLTRPQENSSTYILIKTDRTESRRFIASIEAVIREKHYTLMRYEDESYITTREIPHELLQIVEEQLSVEDAEKFNNFLHCYFNYEDTHEEIK